jgi:Predicted AAA-ATPase
MQLSCDKEDDRLNGVSDISENRNTSLQYRCSLGSSFLENFLQDRSVFVDKTLFIKEFLACMNQVIGILYPRRFGKSLNLDILACFLSIDKQNLDFSGLKISSHVNVVQNHRGKYPIIKLDLKDCKGDTWNKIII